MQKVNLEELAGVAGGVNTGSGSEAANLAIKENQAAVCGMGTTKLVSAGMSSADDTRTVKAYCPSCGQKTMFYIGSGAQSKCSVCNYIRLDL